MHSLFQWSAMTVTRKSAVLGFYVWGIVALLVFAISSDGIVSKAGWLIAACSLICLFLAVFGSEAILKKWLGWLNFPWPV